MNIVLMWSLMACALVLYISGVSMNRRWVRVSGLAVWLGSVFAELVLDYGWSTTIRATAVIVAISGGAYYGYHAVRAGLRLPNRSDEYDRTIREAQQGATSTADLRRVYTDDSDQPRGKHAGDDTRPTMRPV